VKIPFPVLVVLFIGVGIITALAFRTHQSQPAWDSVAIAQQDLPPRPTPPQEPPTDVPEPPTDVPEPPTDVPEPPTDVPEPPTDVPTTPPGPAPTATPKPVPPGHGGGGGSGGGSPDPDPLIIGQTSLYQTHLGAAIEIVCTVLNNGDGVAEDVEAAGILPPFLELAGATTSWGTVTKKNNGVKVEMGDLMPDDKVVIHIQARVVSYAIPPYNSNTVLVSTRSHDANPNNNTARFIFWTFANQ
jgi:hypothetical protein